MYLQPYSVALLSSFLIFGCATYLPLSVRTSTSTFRVITPPVLNESPVVQTAEFNIYEHSSEPGRYFIVPTTLRPIEAQKGTLLAVGLERWDGGHLIFMTTLGPSPALLTDATARLAALSLKVLSLEYYPIEQISIRPLTDPREIANVTFTALPAPGFTPSPFYVLFVVQAKPSGGVIAMKKLLNLNVGILFEGTYILRVRGPTGEVVRSQTFKGVIGNVEVTSLSM